DLREDCLRGRDRKKRRAVRWGGPELRMEGKLSRPSGRRLLFSFLSCFLLFVSTEGGAQERELLRVSTLFLGSSLLPLWVAQDQGIFTRAGLDVQLVWMQSGLSTSALLAGEVDAIFGTPQITLTALMGKNPPPLSLSPHGVPHRSTGSWWIRRSVQSKSWRTKLLPRAGPSQRTMA